MGKSSLLNAWSQVGEAHVLFVLRFLVAMAYR